MKLILCLLILFANITNKLIKFLSLGSGTSVPGFFVEKYFPNILSLLQNRYKKIIFISGTNGKTTTRSCLVSVYESSSPNLGLNKVCTNRGGANIMRGLGSTLLLDQNFFRSKSKSSVLILEVEEATLPKLTKHIQPNLLILTNIFRDQLDAYGEIDKTLSFFSNTLSLCSPDNTKVLVNYDDKKLLTSVVGFSGEIYGFSLSSIGEDGILYELDDSDCNLQTNISFKRIYCANTVLNGFSVILNKEINSPTFIPVTLQGRYNLYNVLVATIVGFWDFNSEVSSLITNIKPVFGRGEKVIIDAVTVEMLLVKNPIGFNENLKYIQDNLVKDSSVIFNINDNIADGRDVSWLWDVDFEKYNNLRFDQIYTSGSRGMDILLRLEYANFDIKRSNYSIDFDKIINEITNSKSRHLYVLSTYTAMLNFRKKLSEMTKLENINHAGN